MIHLKKSKTSNFEEYAKKEDSLFIAFVVSRGVKESKKKPSKPKPKTIEKKITPKIVKLNKVVTPKEKQQIKKELSKRKMTTGKGKLIQVEGLFLKN